jgi:hypothetical protein
MGGIVGIKGDGVFGLSDGHVGEPARRLHGCGVCVGEELAPCVKCRRDWPAEEPPTASERWSSKAVRWGIESGATSMPVARRTRRHYADSDHGGGTLEFEQMTD